MLKRGQEKWDIRYPEDLPIVAHREQIIDLLRRNQVVVIAGETGSGKTTQIPKMCMEAGLARRGRIACTQPRRVAALSISRRIAEELGVEWGHEVGAKIRFTDKTSRDTLIKVMTDGMLLTEIQGDRDLRAYSTIILDEAHERSLNIDFLLGYLKTLLTRRPELKLVITSATIDTAAFSAAFDDAPIVEVSGRLYPVETVYAPIDELLEETGEVTYIDAVVRAIEEIITWNRPGDILVFLPGEKDIRETRDVIDGRGWNRIEILPLFGRLSAAEQDNIFRSSQRRKIILSTNIAETSITIPGIRFVVDSGLARISRYSTQTHVRRLPIEKISQSSADQRKGRAGRLSEGVCIRLYSEQDFESRPKYTTPEILRSNLAEVILRMMAFGLGDIRTFPFIQPPVERAIRAGFDLLEQLGALTEAGDLTPLGDQLARLPVDPTVGRMLIEARNEGCVREILIIAAALSIQDPRERPFEAAQAADAMHARFRHDESDFLTLLNIWNSYHDELERLSQNQLRKFCKSHFLSYLRMREWRDIHTQLERTMKDLGTWRENALPAEYEQVHRALLSGLLAGVATHEEGNIYRATRNRKVMLFPGSALFRKQPHPMSKKKPASAARVEKVKPVKWVFCAEMVETTQLYARTAARMDPQWIMRVGEHVLKYKYTEPYYDEKGERVLARERVLLFGLEVLSRPRGYTAINPDEATEIFIREALVGQRLRTQMAFDQENRKLVERIQEQQTRLRMTSTWGLEERLYQFYRDRLQRVGSFGDLKAFMRDHHGGKDAFLHATEEDLLDPGTLAGDMQAFPDRAQFNGMDIELAYAYKPGADDDGATLKVPVEDFTSIEPEILDWAVPGFVRQRIEHLLRGLPKDLRKQLFPLGDCAQELALRVQPGNGPLTVQLAALIQSTRGIRIAQADFAEEAVPEYLRPRIEVVDRNQRTVATGRRWDRVREQYDEAVREQFKRGDGRDQLQIWQQACRRYEIANLIPGKLPDLPEELLLGDIAGLPVKAFPGIQFKDAQLSLRLFPTHAAALDATRIGLPELVARGLGRELGWLQRDLEREIRRVSLSYVFLMDSATLTAEAFALLRRYLLAGDAFLPIHPDRESERLERARLRLRGIAPRFVDLLEVIASKRDALLTGGALPSPWAQELEALIHAKFLRHLSFDRLVHYPRYLEALRVRMARARQNPHKDAERAALIVPWLQRFQSLRAPASAKQQLRWLIEEYKVQVFAQELGTDGKISLKVLQAAFDGPIRRP